MRNGDRRGWARPAAPPAPAPPRPAAWQHVSPRGRRGDAAVHVSRRRIYDQAPIHWLEEQTVGRRCRRTRQRNCRWPSGHFAGPHETIHHLVMIVTTIPFSVITCTDPLTYERRGSPFGPLTGVTEPGLSSTS